MFINRVETIDQKVSELHELVVHGQMSELCWRIPLSFLNGDYDVE